MGATINLAYGLAVSFFLDSIHNVTSGLQHLGQLKALRRLFNVFKTKMALALQPGLLENYHISLINPLTA